MSDRVYVGLPKQNVPVINQDGTVNIEWYRFFLALYQKTGLGTPGFTVFEGRRQRDPFTPFIYQGGKSALVTWVEFSVVPGTYHLQVFDQVTGNVLGSITLTAPV